MIERTEVEGRKATVAYLLADGFTPADSQDEADLVKIIFDDGEIRFAVPAKGPSDEDGKGDDEGEAAHEED